MALFQSLLYSLFWRLLLPLAFLHLLWRARRQPAYLRHWPERLGFAPRAPSHPTDSGQRPVWLHAVSVGETRAAAPLVESLLAQGESVLMTHTTPTGRATGESLYGDRVSRCYLPYDTPGAVRRFVARARPRMGILMETEVWPNLYAAAERQHIPLLLVNARMSEPSARGYARLGALTRTAFARLAAVGAQTAADAARIAALGATAVSVTGNLKFEVAAPLDIEARVETLRALLDGRQRWLAASTREGEEVLLLDAWLALPKKPLLVIVPRHPQRFDAVAALIRARGLSLQRRSTGEPVRTETQVLLGDSMGELAAWYRLADTAFIGGSLLPLGGQNLIEAAAAGCPVLIGPHTFNFRQAAEDAVAAGAALRVADVTALTTAVQTLMEAPELRQRMAQAGLDFAAAHRGALARTLALIESVPSVHPARPDPSL